MTVGYYQVPLDLGSRKYTAFICSLGLFEYLVFLNLITNASETFQVMMTKVWKGLIHMIGEVYLDDIMIYPRMFPEHIEHARIAMECLKIRNLEIKKWKFALVTISFLSHTISYGNISPSSAKVDQLLQFKSLLTDRQIHSCLGLASLVLSRYQFFHIDIYRYTEVVISIYIDINR